MIQTLFGIFLILHALVHLLYLGQSQRRLELQPGLAWPDGSWMLSSVMGPETVRSLAGSGCILAALGLAAGAVGLWLQQPWWPALAAAAALFSTALFLILWDGRLSDADDKGAVGLLINVAVLAAVFALA